jgi:hypothetical protein
MITILTYLVLTIFALFVLCLMIKFLGIVARGRFMGELTMWLGTVVIFVIGSWMMIVDKLKRL